MHFRDLGEAVRAQMIEEIRSDIERQCIGTFLWRQNGDISSSRRSLRSTMAIALTASSRTSSASIYGASVGGYSTS